MEGGDEQDLSSGAVPEPGITHTDVYTYISMYMNGFLVCTHMGVLMAHFPAQRGNPKHSEPPTQQVFWGIDSSQSQF